MAGLAIYRQMVIYRQIKVVGMSANKTIQRIPNSPPNLGTYPPACKPSGLETGSRADPAYWGNASIPPKSDLRPRHWQR